MFKKFKKKNSSTEPVAAIAYDLPTDKSSVEEQKIELVCPICGYVAEDVPPITCPVCRLSGEKFVKKS